MKEDVFGLTLWVRVIDINGRNSEEGMLE